jgi:hypothetical protein
LDIKGEHELTFFVFTREFDSKKSTKSQATLLAARRPGRCRQEITNKFQDPNNKFQTNLRRFEFCI